ncbi:hypothetical protein L1275_001554 [Flavobacterium sp. HSC-61S13]|nr:hypothetical protein [Flavobacterium sp. HSC-61S13]
MLIFLIGEILINITWFKYLKEKFTEENLKEKISDTETKDYSKTLLRLNISTFKGVMERLIIAICLAIGVAPILIVFGALKIGTRLKSPDDKIQNDYFLIGNLSSIFISVMYVYIFQKTMHLF